MPVSSRLLSANAAGKDHSKPVMLISDACENSSYPTETARFRLLGGCERENGKQFEKKYPG